MKIGSLDISKVMVGSDEVTAIYAGTDLVYSGGTTPPTPPTPSGYSTQYLTLVPTTASSTFQFSQTGLSYSLDSGSTWTSLAASTDTPSVAAGDKILFKASGLTMDSDNGIGKFTSSEKFDVQGNAMSLLYGDNFIGQTSLSGKDYALKKLFESNTNVISAENMILPATTLSNYCYSGMFYGCSGLTATPVLSATSLAEGCYEDMFIGCTSLTTAPQLPSTTLANKCYKGMFFGCSNITTSPILPATALTSDCYRYMFYNCSRLNTITCLATSGVGGTNTGEWTVSVSSSGTFYKNPSMTSWGSGGGGIPYNWTVQDYNPTPPTPTGACISESAGTWVSLDENFDQSTFPLEVYKLDFGGLNTSSLGYGGTNSTGIDLYDANNNWIGQVNVGWDNDQQLGDLEVYSGSSSIYNRSLDASALDVVDICSLFGGAVYIQDVPSVEVCGMYDCVEYDCLEWDEETGECIEQGECIMQECVMTETIYPLEVFVENNS